MDGRIEKRESRDGQTREREREKERSYTAPKSKMMEVHAKLPLGLSRTYIPNLPPSCV